MRDEEKFRKACQHIHDFLLVEFEKSENPFNDYMNLIITLMINSILHAKKQSYTSLEEYKKICNRIASQLYEEFKIAHKNHKKQSKH